MKKNKLKFVLKILQFFITLILLYFIFRKINIQEVKNVFLNMDLKYYSIWILIGIFGLHTIYVIRWKILLNFNNIDYSFFDLYKYHAFALISQSFLPSSFGGDFVRGVFTSRKNKKIKAINVILFARLLGFFILLTMVLVTLPFIKGYISFKLKLLFLICGFLLVILIITFFKFNKIINSKLEIFKIYRLIKK